MSFELDVVLHFKDEIICFRLLALVSGNAHKVGRLVEKVIKIVGEGLYLKFVEEISHALRRVETVFLKIFCSSAPFSLLTHRCRSPSLIKQTRGSILRNR